MLENTEKWCASSICWQPVPEAYAGYAKYAKRCDAKWRHLAIEAYLCILPGENGVNISSRFSIVGAGSGDLGSDISCRIGAVGAGSGDVGADINIISSWPMPLKVMQQILVGITTFNIAFPKVTTKTMMPSTTTICRIFSGKLLIHLAVSKVWMLKTDASTTVFEYFIIRTM